MEIEKKEKMNLVRAALQDADLVLLGIGEAMSLLPEPAGQTDYRRIFELQKPGERKRHILQAYDTLYELVKEKPHFVITMNTDDVIYESSFEREKIVAPCGSVHMLQCRRHILEPFETEPIFERLEDHIRKGGSPEDEEGRKILSCPVCGGLLNPNTIRTEGYLQDAYLPQWKAYTEWLGRTLNRKLCVMELGVSFAHPSVIRFPVEKTVFYNQKAVLIRVNEHFYQLPEEIKGKGIAVKADAADFVLRLKEDGHDSDY